MIDFPQFFGLLRVSQAVRVGDGWVAVGVRESLSVGQVDVMSVGKIVGLAARHASTAADASWSSAEALAARICSGSSETTERSLSAEGLSLSVSLAGSKATRAGILVVSVGVGKSRALSVGTAAESEEEPNISHPAQTSNRRHNDIERVKTGSTCK